MVQTYLRDVNESAATAGTRLTPELIVKTVDVSSDACVNEIAAFLQRERQIPIGVTSS